MKWINHQDSYVITQQPRFSATFLVLVGWIEQKKNLLTRGVVLEDVPRGHILKSLTLASKPQALENCLVLGSRTAIFFWTVEILLEKRQKPRGKFANTFFVFLTWSIGVGKRRGQGPLPIEISPMTKMWQKSLLFHQFQFLFGIFRWQQYNLLAILETKGVQFLPANLNAWPERNGEFCPIKLLSQAHI